MSAGTAIDTIALGERATTYLQVLCADISNRSVGSAGNRSAVEFFAKTATAAGFELGYQPFECIDWTDGGSSLRVSDTDFAVTTSPYSLNVDVAASLIAVSTVAELAAAEIRGRVVLLHGEIAKSQFFPKKFPFYTIDDQQYIIRTLEAKQPAGLITAMPRNSELAGALYPCPLFEDGDFDIPSVYLSAEDGNVLLRLAGQEATLRVRGTRVLSHGQNVIARKGSADQRLVFMAHIDAKATTPGAIDNATGIVTLLLLAEMLRDYQGKLGVEIVAMNGEDNYASPGEQQYLRHNAERFGDMVLGVNLDGLGYQRGKTAFSLYGVPDALAIRCREVFAGYPDLIEGESWYQGDHMLFIMNGRPAVAVTSAEVVTLMTTIIHTAADTPALVDVAKLVQTADALRHLITTLENQR